MFSGFEIASAILINDSMLYLLLAKRTALFQSVIPNDPFLIKNIRLNLFLKIPQLGY
jgi:hypothetical protein